MILDITGKEIKLGMDIVYVNNPETIFTVIIENGEIGHTVKNKDNNFCYQSILLFLPDDSLKTFRLL